LPVLNLPFEIAISYVLTSLLIVQTLLLVVAHQFMRERLGSLLRWLRSGRADKKIADQTEVDAKP
jgi:hypothetical protein